MRFEFPRLDIPRRECDKTNYAENFTVSFSRPIGTTVQNFKETAVLKIIHGENMSRTKLQDRIANSRSSANEG